MSLQRLRIFNAVIPLLALGGLAGCASTPDNYRDPRDPWESYNRAMYQFNSDFDKTIFRPVAKGYRYITPEPVDRGITNFFNNLRDVTSAVNNLLQLKLSRAVSDVGRVVVNSTVGLLGLVDVASNLDMPSYKEDFGQTLGYWGVGSGPYFVLPILGPSDVRDGISLVPDWYTQPIAYLHDNDTQWGLVTLSAIDRRADLLGAGKVLEEAALDPYTFLRDAYLQKRRNEVYDGNPPAEEDWEQEPPGAPGPAQ
jgi:phospholipid-binding lipoprotein MlaA